MFVQFCNHIINVEEIKYVENSATNKKATKFEIKIVLKDDKEIRISGFDLDSAARIFSDIKNACFEYNKKSEKLS